ncbi:hypothetical protein HU200_036054 [Digitaria exilis]|uniref:Non-haem dioxygenase N-terminal domain-containing protein n=1 Tax=Digitaria exilis TaxID=1010633 RepID=A0A835BQV1_9POAL|nr:hypothetical protein HU200_036054 [Digitaria exilis]
MEIPTVDLRGLAPGAPGWEATRAAVTASMVAYGCVVVANGDDTLGLELRRAVFGRALPELFALPFESKKAAYEQGYSSQINGMTHEIIRIYKPANSGSVRALADFLWPEGNPEFW